MEVNRPPSSSVVRQADKFSRYAQQVEAALRALMSGQAFPLYEEIEDLIRQSVVS